MAAANGGAQFGSCPVIPVYEISAAPCRQCTPRSIRVRGCGSGRSLGCSALLRYAELREAVPESGREEAGIDAGDNFARTSASGPCILARNGAISTRTSSRRRELGSSDPETAYRGFLCLRQIWRKKREPGTIEDYISNVRTNAPEAQSWLAPRFSVGKRGPTSSLRSPVGTV